MSTTGRLPMLEYDATTAQWVPIPGYEIRGNQIHIKINSLGFRGDELTRQKPANTVRIACLGASTTFNAEVSGNHATWPHRLQERLRAANPGVNVEVINAAVPGYSSADALKALRHRVLPLDPDLVIYYEANNEIVRDTRGLLIRRGLLDRSRDRQPSLITALSKHSLLVDQAYKNLAILARSRNPAKHTLDAIPADLPSHFTSVLDAMRRELAERDVPLVLSTFIVKYRRDQDRATQIANADVAFYYMPWMSIDGMLDAVDRYNAAIVEFATDHGLPVVDDREAIPADAEHFVDCMHFADAGADLMAERFFWFLHSSPELSAILERSAVAGAAPTSR